MQSELQPRTQLRLWRCRQLGQLIPARCNGRNHSVLLLRVSRVRTGDDGMIAVSGHSCKTSFAGGVNIFRASQQHLTQRQYPVEDMPIANTQLNKQTELLAILTDGYFTLAALSKTLGITRTAVYERLLLLMRAGEVKRRQCVGTRAHEYTRGRPTGTLLTRTERVLQLVRTEPFLTARQISAKLRLEKTTSLLADLFAKEVIARRKNRQRAYVYYCVGQC